MRSLRPLYDWVLHWADTPYGTPALFLISFIESSFFPVPPDVLFFALVFAHRERAFYYAAICTVGSVMGGMFGYYLGHEFFAVVNYIVAFVVGKAIWYGIAHEGARVVTEAGFTFYAYPVGSTYESDTSLFLWVQQLYDQNEFMAVFIAGFTPIPYKVFTVAAGYFNIPFSTLVLASILGRGGRFFGVSLLLWVFGPPIKRFIEKYFDWISVLFVVLIVLGFLIMNYVL
ncbi:MAG: DedA family protein [Candidatus Aureabacteria bacterium]|nr:DedA family protein [Candidatus Auribacterota bacterium]